MKRFLGWSIMLIALGFVFFGFVSWSVRGVVQVSLNRMAAQSGWRFEVGQAHWLPWGALEVSDLKIQTPTGGRVHLVRADITTALWPLFQGRWLTSWRLGEIRIDPGSFGIHKPLIQELLSTGPLTTWGKVFLESHQGKYTLKEFLIQGGFVQLAAQGWLEKPERLDVQLQGRISHRLLEEIPGASLAGKGSLFWSPFEVHFRGKLSHPEFSFRSDFLSFSLNSPEKEQPW